MEVEKDGDVVILKGYVEGGTFHITSISTVGRKCEGCVACVPNKKTVRVCDGTGRIPVVE